MTEPTQAAEVLGEAGEACRECGAPLAIDQRYCLNCGRRRGGPRVDFRRHLDGEQKAGANGAAPPPADPAATSVPGPRQAQRDYAPLAAVGGIAVLGLMLLVGVLIGKGDGDSSTSSQPVQVVSPSTAGEAAVAGGEESGERNPQTSKQAKAKGSGKKKSAGKGGGSQPVEASDQALRELQEQSPEEYQESSAKLPDEIATGGAPPPEDNKAPGGGSKGTAIE